MEGDDDETEKRFSETTFGNFNEQWKEFKDAPGDILQLDHDCVEEQDQKNKKSEEEDSDDDEEKGDDVPPEPSAWTPALDAGAEIRL